MIKRSESNHIFALPEQDFNLAGHNAVSRKKNFICGSVTGHYTDRGPQLLNRGLTVKL